MSNFKPLVIGDLKIEKPVIQGGMGVGISLHRLAGAVAKAGGMGIISAAQIGFREPDFTTNFVEANLRSIRREMKLAREIAPQGAIGFNIMVATKHYDMWVKEAVKAGADIIILNQPTRGVDVGAMEFIHKKILEMRDEKKSLILVSADLAELKALSDRIIVFHQGTIAGVLDDVPNTTEEELGLYMLGLKSDSEEKLKEA